MIYSKKVKTFLFVFFAFLFVTPAVAFEATEIPSHPEIFSLVEKVATQAKYLFDTNKDEGRGIGFSYDCIYFQAFCAEASPRGNIFDLRLTIDSRITGKYLFLCIMSGDRNMIKCRSPNPLIYMSFQKSGDDWVSTYDTLSLLGQGYGKTFHSKKSCNTKGCEKPLPPQ